MASTKVTVQCPHCKSLNTAWFDETGITKDSAQQCNECKWIFSTMGFEGKDRAEIVGKEE